MNFRTNKQRLGQLSHALLLTGITLLFLSSGCARKPWGQPVAEDRYSITVKMLAEMRRNETLRSSCIDADINIFFTSTVKNRAINGYVQLMQPASVKFVTSNPLGQPLVAFFSDGHTVQFVNAMDGYFTDGSLESFARVFDIPTVAYTSDWGTWLTARLPRAIEVTEVREDENNRGFWIGFTDKARKEMGMPNRPIVEHVLIDTDRRIVLERAFTNTKGSIKARISYEDLLPETAEGQPLQPAKITISGLDYSGKLVLEFSALQAVESCRPGNFQVTRPAGYRYQPLPED